MTFEDARGRTLAVGGLFAFCVALYAQTLGFDFISFDDPTYVVDNEKVRAGLTLEGVRWALGAMHFSNWHPLTWISYQLDASLFGIDPAGFHATNVLLHALAVVLVFRIFERATGRPGPALAVAALMACHPMHVEVVAWVSQRKELLAAVFGLLAIDRYLVWRLQRGGGQYAALLVFSALAMMSKPTWIALPVWLLLLDRWPLARIAPTGEAAPAAARLRARIVEKLPLFAFAGGTALLVLLAQRGAIGSVPEIAAGDRLANAVVACVAYLGKTLWPTGLSLLYPHPALPGGAGLEASQVALAALVLLAISALAIASRRRAPALALGWAWFLVGLAPTLGVVQVGWQGMADRYSYAPHIGLFAAVVFGIADAARRLRVPRGASATLALLCVVAASVLCVAQTRVWRDSVSLFRASLAATPDSPLLHYNLANRLLEAGDGAGARAHYEHALLRRPFWPEARQNLAWLLATASDPELRDPERALELAERAAKAHAFRDANSLDTLAAAQAAGGDFAAAQRTAARALELARLGERAELAAAIEERLRAYRAGRPHVEVH